MSIEYEIEIYFFIIPNIYDDKYNKDVLKKFLSNQFNPYLIKTFNR